MNEYETKAVFAKNLSRLLQQNGQNQVDLMRALGVSKSTVSSWCTGEKMPRMDKIEAIARHFGVHKSALLENDASGISFDDFTYAFFEESKELTPENKQKLLEMARFFKLTQQNETDES